MIDGAARADRSGAFLFRANLSAADLHDANLSSVGLIGTDLSYVDLSVAKNAAQAKRLDDACGVNTKFPDGFTVKLKPCPGKGKNCTRSSTARKVFFRRPYAQMTDWPEPPRLGPPEN